VAADKASSTPVPAATPVTSPTPALSSEPAPALVPPPLPPPRVTPAVLPDPGWTLSTLHQHFDALRVADERFYTERDRRYAEVTVERERMATERDRRYAEVSVEREKALKIKEVADLAALQLAREIQTYKDEKANELREQISSERGHYASKDDLANVADKLEAQLKPITDYMASSQGRVGGHADSTRNILAIMGLALTAVIILVTIYLSKH
jgi:multidrug efflux pump subunit AcrB